MKTIILVMAMALMVALPVCAQASLVDTGTPDESVSWYASGGEIWQYLSSQFEVSQASVVTGLQGYFYDRFGFATPGTMGVALYKGNTIDPNFNMAVPDISNEIYRGAFTIDNADHTDDDFFGGWHGISGLSLSVDPGVYWIAFEGSADGAYSGAMAGISPDPLMNAAWAQVGVNDDKYNYFDPDSNGVPMGLGVKVDGVATQVVPEPASCLLFSTGLLGFLGKRVKNRFSRKNKQA